jgi:hypothetical protein
VQALKILYITSLFSQYAGSGSIQNLGYINGLSNNIGRDNVDIMTVKWPDSMIDQRMLAMTFAGNIYYDNVSVINRYFGCGGQQAANKILGGFPFLRKAKKLLVETLYFPSVDKEWIKTYSKLDFSQYEYIISSSDTKTAHFVGAEIQKLYPAIKWIQIWGDPWCKDITIEPITRLRSKKHEQWLLSAADIIFYVSGPTMNEMKTVFPECAWKMHYIPRGYATEVIREIKRQEQSEITMLYSGFLNATRDISQFSLALKDFNSQSVITLKLKIFGFLDTASQEAILGNSDIEFCGSTDYSGIIDEYRKCDALLYIGNPSGANQIPGKLFDYLGTNNSVLALVYNNQDETTFFLKSLDRLVVSVNTRRDVLTALHKVKDEVLHKKLTPYYGFSSRSIMKDMLKKSEEFILNNHLYC